MTKLELYIYSVRTENKSLFSAEKIAIRPDAIIKIITKAYNAGHADGLKFSKEMEKMKPSNSPLDDFLSMLKK